MRPTHTIIILMARFATPTPRDPHTDFQLRGKLMLRKRLEQTSSPCPKECGDKGQSCRNDHKYDLITFTLPERVLLAPQLQHDFGPYSKHVNHNRKGSKHQDAATVASSIAANPVSLNMSTDKIAHKVTYFASIISVPTDPIRSA